jgi:hypothetical protein
MMYGLYTLGYQDVSHISRILGSTLVFTTWRMRHLPISRCERILAHHDAEHHTVSYTLIIEEYVTLYVN